MLTSVHNHNPTPTKQKQNQWQFIALYKFNQHGNHAKGIKTFSGHMYRLYILETNKNARTICALCVNSRGWKHQCNKWDYKGTSLHKRKKTQPTGSSKSAELLHNLNLRGKKKQNLINIYRIQCDPILQNLHIVSSLFLCSFSWLSGSTLWLL